MVQQRYRSRGSLDGSRSGWSRDALGLRVLGATTCGGWLRHGILAPGRQHTGEPGLRLWGTASHQEEEEATVEEEQGGQGD